MVEKMQRDRKSPLKVYVSSSDRDEIMSRAMATKLSISDYLRTVGIGHSPKSILDQDAIIKLVQLHADQGRLGGLLKLWLTSRPGEGAKPIEIRQLLKEIEKTQKEIQALVAKL